MKKDVQFYAFLITALDEGTLSVSRPDHFTPEEITRTVNGKEVGCVPETVWTL
jgi:hypothetical protein